MFRSLRVRNFRLFFAGQLVSLCGTWMQNIAQSTFVLFRLNGSGRQLGILTACQFVPVLLIGLWAGAVVDRSDKRRILMGTQVLMGLTAIAQTVAVVMDAATFPLLCSIAVLFGVGNAFDMPARQAFVSEMVTPNDLPNAVSLSSAIFNAGRIVGLALAGLIISSIGYAWCFGINALSFVAILAGLVMMRTSELWRSAPVKRAKGQITEGVRYVRRIPVLRTVIALVFVLGTFSFNFQVFVPLLAKDVFHGEEGKVAQFQVLVGLGSLTGAVLGARRGSPSARLLIAAMAALSACMLGLALSPWEPLTMLLLLLTGMFFITFVVTANPLLQLSSDPTQRGRVLALYVFVFTGTTPIGGPFIGWFADTFGPRQSVALGGGAALLATVGGLRALRRGFLDASSSPVCQALDPLLPTPTVDHV